MSNQLKKEINSIGLFFTSLSCMIGSGWLLSSIVAAKIAGPAAILSWLIGGILICFIAITFSELSTAFPVAGGIARYGQFSHGSCVSFIVSWLAWLSCVAVAPTEATAMLQYASRFFDGLIIKQQNIDVLTQLGMIWAVIIVTALTWINIQGIKKMIQYNNILTTWKIVMPMIVLVILCFNRFESQNFTSASFMPNGIKGVFEALATTVIFSYLGFRECTSLAAEVKNPQKSIPIACIGSVGYCMLFYLFMQSVFIGAVSGDILDNGWSMLSYPNDSGPFAGLAMALGLHWLATLIYIDAIVTPSGSGLVYTATTSRLVLAMSQNRFLPEFFSKLNIHGVPRNAIIVNAIVGITMLAPFDGWVAIVKYQSSAIVLAYAIGPIALLALRTNIPDHPRPFKLPYEKTLSLITLYICMLLVYWSGWDTVFALVMSMIIGLLIFIARIGYKELRNALWLVPFMIIISIVSYYGHFGGNEILPPHADMIILFIGSMAVLYAGYQCRLGKQLSKFYLNDTSQKYYDAI